MDGNLTRAGITADLEAMRAAGLGGVVICEVNVGVPRGPVEFMSAEWRSLFKHVVREAERLGLEVTLNAGPGWTGSGGPWVEPEQSMQHIVAAAVEASGPARFDAVLPRPTRRPAFFGEGGLPQALKDRMDGFYRDVAVVAFPAPAPGPPVADIDEKALYVRAPYSSQPGVRPFLPAPADFPALPPGAAIDPARIVDLTDKLTAEGRLVWDVPAGRWTVLRFGRTTTGANTRPAPVPGLGLECDKLDAAAFDAHYDAFVGALLREIGPRRTDGAAGWTTLHIDSWEMGAQNWTAAFREEFQKRRGYDLLPYLPAVTGRPVGSLELTERFLWDLRQTAQELVLENHAYRLKELGRRDGFRLSIEPYDMTPLADMTLGTAADVPMGEFWLYGYHTAHSVFEAAGIAHTGGKNVVAAESFTSDDTEAWRAHPASMKALGDWAFAAGINRIVFHRYQNQAGLGLSPGMTMGPYGVHWERTQTWWDMVPAYHLYLARCQFLLRRGVPVADVCFLVAEGAPHAFRPPASALRGDPPVPAGAAFDGCPPETLLASAGVEDGKVVFPGGASYRVLVLPERETMTPKLLRKVRDLVAAGATVVGPRPRKSPSLSGYPDCDAEVARLASEVWGDCDGEKVTEHALGQGRVVWRKTPTGLKAPRSGAAAPVASTAIAPAEPLSPDRTTWHVGAPPLDEPGQYGDFATVMEVLERMSVRPDFSSDAPLNWTHRRDGETEIYFVANPEGRAVETAARFRVSGKRPEIWDPVTGAARDLTVFAEENGRVSVPLRFEPHQSFFVVFRDAAAPASGVVPNPSPASAIRPDFPVQGGDHNALRAVGRFVRSRPGRSGTDRLRGPRRLEPQARARHQVLFRDGRLRQVVRNSAGRYGSREERSRLARPRKGREHRFRPAQWSRARRRLVRSLAGGDHGCDPPQRQSSGDPRRQPLAEPSDRRRARAARCRVRPGGNLARWPDWLLKGEPRPSAGRLTFSTWKHYTRDSPLLPSGLLGPVTVLAQRD